MSTTNNLIISDLQLMPQQHTGPVLHVPHTGWSSTRKYLNGKLHSSDGPAVAYMHGGQEWYINGKKHREGNLPAVIDFTGKKEWWVEGKLHREGDLPAIEHPDGYKAWYQNGLLHRPENHPAIEHPGGKQEFWVNGNEVVTSTATQDHKILRMKILVVPKGFTGIIELECGNKGWYLDGHLHREDGPAFIFANKRCEYWYYGEHYTNKEFDAILFQKCLRELQVDYEKYDQIAKEILTTYQEEEWFLELELCFHKENRRLFFRIISYNRPIGFWVAPFKSGVEILLEEV